MGTRTYSSVVVRKTSNLEKETLGNQFQLKDGLFTTPQPLGGGDPFVSRRYIARENKLFEDDEKGSINCFSIMLTKKGDNYKI